VPPANPGKARELAVLLAGIPFHVVSLRDMGLPLEIEEPGETMEVPPGTAHRQRAGDAREGRVRVQVRPAGRTDEFLIRLAEMYLIAAEAQLNLGNAAAAADYLNVIRERAALPGHEAEMRIGPGDVTIDFILDERARELAGERAGHRAQVGGRRPRLQELDGAQRAAAALEAAVRQGAEPDLLAGEVDMALQRGGIARIGALRWGRGTRRVAPLPTGNAGRQCQPDRQNDPPPHDRQRDRPGFARSRAASRTVSAARRREWSDRLTGRLASLSPAAGHAVPTRRALSGRRVT
jgi:hypothetical protein